MKPHPRIRKTIKWGGAAVTMLLAVVWVASFWVWGIARYRWPQSWCLGYTSVVELEWGRFPISSDNVGVEFRRAHAFGEGGGSGFIWSVGRRGGMVQAPLWCLTLASALGTGAAWWFDHACRRPRAGRCPKCNYDRAGIAPDAKCPECGAMPVVASR